jgi:hypothetical protein
LVFFFVFWVIQTLYILVLTDRVKSSIFNNTTRMLICLKEQFDILPKENQVNLDNLNVFNLTDDNLKMVDNIFIENKTELTEVGVLSKSDIINNSYFKKGFLKNREL